MFKNILKTVLITAVITTILVLALVFFLRKSGDTEELTSRTIIEKISEQSFLVTKTVVLDQRSSIKVDKGSAWSNFLWGQTIDADALIRVDIGVDFSQLKEEDIRIDHVQKRVIIDLPKATVLDASQFGAIEVKSTRGVLKFLLDNDPNQDHNQALELLVKDATSAVEENQELFDEARMDASKMLELIIGQFGYSVEVS